MSRLETGPVRCGSEDWAGIFFRGDDAFAAAFMIQTLLDLYHEARSANALDENIEARIGVSGAESLIETLLSCREPLTGGNEATPIMKGKLTTIIDAMAQAQADMAALAGGADPLELRRRTKPADDARRTEIVDD